MAHHQLRNENHCLNCGHQVEERFCSHCGQENIEPKQTFGQLIGHFFEDLTHYEGKFWGTLVLLFFKPAYLTKEFISGKRAKYLPPVRLYIFASFLAFLVPALIPHVPHKEEAVKQNVDEAGMLPDSLKHEIGSALVESGNKLDSIGKAMNERDSVQTGIEMEDGKAKIQSEFNTIHELDSARAARVGTDKEIDYITYVYYKRIIEYKNKYTSDVFTEMLVQTIGRNVPKALFLYMPMFALLLGLFHRRKNWWFFDHGIFTLHYFSFILLSYLVYVILSGTSDWIVYVWPAAHLLNTIVMWLLVGLIFWIPYYLYRGHRKMYGESRFVSWLKVTGILILNIVLLIAVAVALVFISFLVLH